MARRSGASNTRSRPRVTVLAPLREWAGSTIETIRMRKPARERTEGSPLLIMFKSTEQLAVTGVCSAAWRCSSPQYTTIAARLYYSHS